jgi:phage I-like protein
MKTASLIASAAVSAHASDLSSAALATHAAELSAADAGGTWLQLVPAGTFSGRDGRGPFTTGDKAEMEKIVATTKRYRGPTDLAIDYDHQSMFGAVPGVGGVAPAAGWVKELEVRDDGIWGRVEWTARAANAIRSGEYRYLSPVFLHTKAGKVLLIRNAGLTNDPNFNLAQVAASTELNDLNDEGDTMDKIIAALGLKQDAGEDQVLAAVNALKSNTTAIAKALGLKDDAKHEEVLEAINAAAAPDEDRKKVAAAAGLKEDATVDEIVTAIGSFAKDGKPDPAKFVPIEQVTALQNDVKSMREEMTAGKAEEAVNSAIKDGKLAPALKDWGMDLAKRDIKQFETFVGSAPKLTSQQLTEPNKSKDAAPALDEAQLAVCRQLGLDPKDFAETLKEDEQAAD